MDSQALKIWRGTLLVMTAAECCIQTGASYWQGSFRPETMGGVYGSIARSAPLLLLLTATTLISLWRFLGPAASLSAGFIALASMKMAAETFQRVFAVHHQDFYQGGALLTGVVIGEAYARIIGVRAEHGRAASLEARRFGMTGALGMLAGSYLAAGTSKLLAGGVNWATSSTVRLMILSHGEVEGSPWSQAIPHWTANHPFVCMALELGTLIVQLGAFMLIVGPRARRLWAVLIVVFHLGIYLTSHILFLTPMLFAAAVAVPWASLLRAQSVDTEEVGKETDDLAQAETRPGVVALLALSGVVLLRLATGW